MKAKKTEDIFIYGRHALEEALAAMPAAVKRVHLADGLFDSKLQSILDKAGIKPQRLSPGAIEREVGADTVHQGVIARIATDALLVDLDVFTASCDTTKNPSVVVLGGLHDPHNVGAVIRSAAAFGVSGVLIPERSQAPITGTVAKTSAGMIFRVPLVRIKNVNDALRRLKEKGFWVYGLSLNGNPLAQEKFNRPAAFVLGNESDGIREKTLEACDISLTIPIDARCESLNAAVAAGVVLYAWSAQRV